VHTVKQYFLFFCRIFLFSFFYSVSVYTFITLITDCYSANRERACTGDTISTIFKGVTTRSDHQNTMRVPPIRRPSCAICDIVDYYHLIWFVGVDNYLFIIPCLNQMSLLSLLIKLIQIIFGIINIESCKIVSYLFSVFTRLTYWLTSWVTIDRLLVVLFPTSIALKNPRLAIEISIVTSLCLFAMHIHEIIHYTIIPHLFTDSSICVTNFDIHFSHSLSFAVFHSNYCYYTSHCSGCT
jgi:hypothetical protein